MIWYTLKSEMSTYRHVLLTGGTGALGQSIVHSDFFPSLLAPSHQQMDITDVQQTKKFFIQMDIDAVIHCAAIAQMSECEKDPLAALRVNLLGTTHLVTAIMEKEKITRQKIRMVHVSTDGVYPGTEGNYSETDTAIPYNAYGWTKLGAECAVRLLSNHCIIRTSFFNPKNIRFGTSAMDNYSSKITLDQLTQAIFKLLHHSFIGTINVGEKRKSNYERYKAFKKNLEPCAFEDIVKTVSFPLAQDTSMNCTRWEKIQNE